MVLHIFSTEKENIIESMETFFPVDDFIFL